MRIFILIIFIISAAFLLFKTFENPGVVNLSWQGYYIETSTAFLLTLAGILAVLAFWGGKLWTILVNAPVWWKNKNKWKAQNKAIQQFVEGMEASTLGEKSKVEKMAKSLAKNNAQLSGLLWTTLGDTSSEESQKALEHLSTAPTGKVLSLLTLAKQAQSVKQWQSMKTLMEQAYALKPKAPEVVYLYFKACLHMGSFEQALKLTDSLKLSGYYSSEELDMLTAALYTQLGFAEVEEEHQLKFYKKALQVMPQYIPAMEAIFKLDVNDKLTLKWAEACPHDRVLDMFYASVLPLSDKKRRKRIESLIVHISRKLPEYKMYADAYLQEKEGQFDASYEAYRQAVQDLPHKKLYKKLAELELKITKGGNRRVAWLEQALEVDSVTFMGEDVLHFEKLFNAEYPVVSQVIAPKVNHVQ